MPLTIVETPLAGLVLIAIEPASDERGFFARTWCADELAAAGLDVRVAQCSIAHNIRAGTLRGMHWQVAPHVETKLVRCTRGALLDVVVDIRTGSPTHLEHYAVELAADNHLTLCIPPGFAHGYQTLVDDVEVLYMMSAPHEPGAARGARFDDPAFGIDWPHSRERTMSERDRGWAPYEAERASG